MLNFKGVQENGVLRLKRKSILRRRIWFTPLQIKQPRLLVQHFFRIRSRLSREFRFRKRDTYEVPRILGHPNKVPCYNRVKVDAKSIKHTRKNTLASTF